RLARSAARRSARRLHRLCCAEVRRRRADGGARLPPPYRQGPAPRSLAGGGVDSFPRRGGARLYRERSCAAAGRQRRSDSRAARVPASEVLTIAQIFAEPQLNHRQHFISVPHAVLGSAYVENSRTRMSATPAVVTHAGPALGQHNDEVLRELLGMSDDEIIEAV